MKRFFIVFLICIQSCTVYEKIQLPNEKMISGTFQSNFSTEDIAKDNTKNLGVYDEEKAFLSKEDYSWGLALSGGGVRSASYCLGSLKALYDQNILDKFDIISTVSGGGYISYFLYNNFKNKNSNQKPFGFYSLDNEHFLKNTCSLQNKGNFMPNYKSFFAFFNTPKGAFNIYKNQIEKTYGEPSPRIDFLRYEIKDNQAPYFIINSTIASTKNSDWASRIFEITPFWHGSPELGYKTWQNNTFLYSDATTISAAALKWKLLKKIPNYSSEIDSKKIGLSDGGHSENLAVLSLIRRGVENIVVIDAEHNENYSFDGYKILKDSLRSNLNLDLQIKEIDNYISSDDPLKSLENSVFKGVIKNIPTFEKGYIQQKDINLYYVKMSLSDDILDEIACKQNNGEKDYQYLMLTACQEGKFKDGSCDYYLCDQLEPQKISSIDITELSKFWVKSYSEFLNNSKWSKINYTFPHIPTLDQKMYRDQLVALVGLGYLQTKNLKESIDFNEINNID